MADLNHQHQQLSVANCIDDAIIAATNAIEVFKSMQMFMPGRAGVTLKHIDFFADLLLNIFGL